MKTTYYGTSHGGRVLKYLCAVCEAPLESVRETEDASILKCSGCGTKVGYTRRLPKLPTPGQLDIDGHEA